MPTFLTLGFGGTNSHGDQKPLWRQPFGKCGSLRGGKQELTRCFLIPLCFQLFFKSWSHSLACWCPDLYHGLVLLSLRANTFSSETASHFFPVCASPSLGSISGDICQVVQGALQETTLTCLGSLSSACAWTCFVYTVGRTQGTAAWEPSSLILSSLGVNKEEHLGANWLTLSVL